MPEGLTKPQVLIPEVKIQSRVREIARQINQEYEGREIVAICILKGSFVFFSDLIRAIDVPLTCEFLGLSSYGNQTHSSGEVKVTLDINTPLRDRHVLVVEDIVDSGLTLSYIQTALSARQPASIRTASLLFKPDALETDVEIDYVGFNIGNEFVVGYGLDYAQKYRGIPYIGCLKNEH